MFDYGLRAPFADGCIAEGTRRLEKHQETRSHRQIDGPDILIPLGPPVRDKNFETLARELRFQLDVFTQYNDERRGRPQPAVHTASMLQ